MAIQRVVVVLAIVFSSYRYGMAEDNSSATTPGIRGSHASTGRVVETRTGGRRDRSVDAAKAPTNIKATIPRREEHEIRVEKRLLWRNETPFDDDFAENDKRPHDDIRPGLISTTLDTFHQGVLGRTGSKDDESVADTPDAAITIEVGTGITIEVGSKTTTTDGNAGDESGVSEGEDTSGMGDNANDTNSDRNGDETIETVIKTNHDGNTTFEDEFIFEDFDDDYFSNSTFGLDSDFGNETLSATNSRDCSWSFSTGTGCSSSTIGDIVNGYQHEYLIADGECRYNDFLGYYRAGCRREFIDPSQFVSVAKVVLTKVFCTDPKCSMGCLEESSVRPNSEYTSNICYRSSYYNGQDSSGSSFEMDSKNSRDLDFSFEFVGACVEYESCNFIE